MNIMMDHNKFFDKVRDSLFRGSLKQSQVDGVNAIIQEAEEIRLNDLRQLAYMLATTYHETAKTMAPIEEYGKGQGRAYGKLDYETGHRYYGRGFVQLTWKDNYKRLGDLLGVDLVKHPEKALELSTATKILFKGMTMGLFTGKKLDDYINSAGTDYVNARRIINGTDRADLIAGYADKFYEALT